MSNYFNGSKIINLIYQRTGRRLQVNGSRVWDLLGQVVFLRRVLLSLVRRWSHLRNDGVSRRRVLWFVDVEGVTLKQITTFKL